MSQSIYQNIQINYNNIQKDIFLVKLLALQMQIPRKVEALLDQVLEVPEDEDQ